MNRLDEWLQFLILITEMHLQKGIQAYGKMS